MHGPDIGYVLLGMGGVLVVLLVVVFLVVRVARWAWKG